jgi:hypothetical protein
MFARFFNRNERYRGIESNDDWQSEYVFRTFRCWKSTLVNAYRTHLKQRQYRTANKGNTRQMYDLSFDARIVTLESKVLEL